MSQESQEHYGPILDSFRREMEARDHTGQWCKQLRIEAKNEMAHRKKFDPMANYPPFGSVPVVKDYLTPEEAPHAEIPR